MKLVASLALPLFALGCSADGSLEQAAAALFQGRVAEAAAQVRALAPAIEEGGFAPADLLPFTDDELRALVEQTVAAADDSKRFQLAPRGLIGAREPTFLWDSTGKEPITIKIIDGQGDETSFEVPDMAPFRPMSLKLTRGTTYRWTLFNAAGEQIADWLEFKIADEEVARRQQKLLQFLSTRVSVADHRSLLTVQFYRHQHLDTEALGLLQYLAAQYPQNARVRLEMAACLAQLGNDYAAKAFLDTGG